jgi:ceramide glucosyltransferase
MAVLALLAALLTVIGVALVLAGGVLVRRFQAGAAPEPVGLPGVTVLKPLCGDEPLLEAALASICEQDYPRFQVIFGVEDPNDAALAAVARVRARFPACDIEVVAGGTQAGNNRKVANLINMLSAARYDMLVISDSDVRAAPDCLRRIVAALEVPGTGLVTTLYAGLPAQGSLAAQLGATAITHGFLPGTLLARICGRRDALGATMALRRETLAAVGGFAALRDHLADDNLLGQKVRELGLTIALAATVPGTTVPEARLSALFRHELRWARTIRSLSPCAFAGSALQYPLAWALMALVLSTSAGWAVLLLAAAWIVRAGVARRIDEALGLVAQELAAPAPLWLLPLRDLLSMTVLLASYAGDQVEWRGRIMRADRSRARSNGMWSLTGTAGQFQRNVLQRRARNGRAHVSAPSSGGRNTAGEPLTWKLADQSIKS